MGLLVVEPGSAALLPIWPAWGTPLQCSMVSPLPICVLRCRPVSLARKGLIIQCSTLSPHLGCLESSGFNRDPLVLIGILGKFAFSADFVIFLGFFIFSNVFPC